MTLIRFEQQNLWSIDGSVEQVMTDIRCACSGGFVAAFGIEWNGPKFSHNELPASWIEAYNAGGLLVADPLAHWATKRPPAWRSGLRYGILKTQSSSSSPKSTAWSTALSSLPETKQAETS